MTLPEERCIQPTRARALRDLRFYAVRLCQDKPSRYEVYQTADGGTVRLSDCIKILLQSCPRCGSEAPPSLCHELPMMCDTCGRPIGHISDEAL